MGAHDGRIASLWDTYICSRQLEWYRVPTFSRGGTHLDAPIPQVPARIGDDHALSKTLDPGASENGGDSAGGERGLSTQVQVKGAGMRSATASTSLLVVATELRVTKNRRAAILVYSGLVCTAELFDSEENTNRWFIGNPGERKVIYVRPCTVADRFPPQTGWMLHPQDGVTPAPSVHPGCRVWRTK